MTPTQAVCAPVPLQPPHTVAPQSLADSTGGEGTGLDQEIALLTVIVPVYNEVATIDQILAQVLAAPYPKQVVIVDDGSNDGTAPLLQKWAAQPEVLLLRQANNRGKGAAIRAALAYARGRFTLIQDADLEYDPGDYPRLVEPLLRGEAQVVYGSRYLADTGPAQGIVAWCRYGVMLLNRCVRLLYGVWLTDEATCYKVFPTALLRAMDLRCERFEFCSEVTAKACRMGLPILEVPIHYQPRSREAGKKIRWTDGLQALLALWKWRSWSPRLEVAAQVVVASSPTTPLK